MNSRSSACSARTSVTEPVRAAPALNINLSWSTVSASGMRPPNEDALAEGQCDNMVCFVMADGAGGHARGDVAARTVVETVRRRFLREAEFSPQALHRYIDAARSAVALGKRQPGQHDMSATVALVLIDQRQRRALWSHLGDTRIYLFRRGRARQLTKDHSVAQQFVDAGYVAPEQLRGHPQRHLLFAAIGADHVMPVEAGGDALAVEHGDAMLICTDGFWEWVLEADMEACLAASATSADWLTAMCAIGHRNAHAAARPRDNFSACAICLSEPAAGQGWP